MLNKLKQMAEMQNATNVQLVGVDWTQRDNDFMLAVGMESVEIIDAVGWKWWKHIPDFDLAQVQLEIVDIWHFILGHKIREHHGDLDACALDLMVEYSEFQHEHVPSIKVLKKLASKAFDGQCDISLFILSCEHFGLDFEQLYSMYIIKNTLVKFRDDHGYKLPTYIKVWGGKEDNVHLMECAAELDSTDINFRDNLYAAMVKSYPGESVPTLG